MINVMLDPLPDEWHGYEINTSFRIGIQVLLVQYDKELNEYEKSDALIWLLFDDREHPDGEELQECVEWFLNGWFHDKSGSSQDKRRLIDLRGSSRLHCRLLTELRGKTYGKRFCRFLGTA